MRRLAFAAFIAFGIFGNGAPRASVAQQPSEVIERTMAIVGNQVVTLSDVRTALELGLVPRSPEPDALGAATERLVERLLVLREVQRYAPPEPPDAQVEERLAGVRARFPTPALLTQALEASGFTEASVRAWLRDDLRIASYLSQRFAAATAPSDEEINAYYTAHRDEFDRAQQSFDAAAPVIRDRLSGERRTELIDDWVAGLRRRTPVVELWKSGGGRAEE